MTRFTKIGGVDVGDALASGYCSIMATETSAQDLGVIHGRWGNRDPKVGANDVTGLA